MKYNIEKGQQGFKVPFPIEKPKEPVNKKQIDQNWDRIVEMYNKARNSELNNSHVTGLIGNIVHETMGSFDPKQKQLDGGPGRGIIQWEKGTERYKDFARNVKNPLNFDDQYNFILKSLTAENTINSTLHWGAYGNQNKWIKNKNMSPEESAAAFSNLYLRPGEPNIEERQKATRYIHDKLQKEMRLKPDWSVINKIKSNFVSIQKKGGWIQKAVDPAHKGYCTPMTKATCTPHRKALARRFKSGEFKKHQQGGSLLSISNILAKWKK